MDDTKSKEHLTKEVNRMATLKRFLEVYNDSGFGIALIDQTGKTIEPYIDANDYPDMLLDDIGDFARITYCPSDPTLVDGWLQFHSGILECEA